MADFECNQLGDFGIISFLYQFDLNAHIPLLTRNHQYPDHSWLTLSPSIALELLLLRFTQKNMHTT